MGFAALYPSYASMGSLWDGWSAAIPIMLSVASPWEHARMTGYRRNFVAGGSFFFTVNLMERRLGLLTQHIDELRSAFRETRRRHPFTSMR